MASDSELDGVEPSAIAELVTQYSRGNTLDKSEVAILEEVLRQNDPTANIEEIIDRISRHEDFQLPTGRSLSGLVARTLNSDAAMSRKLGFGDPVVLTRGFVHALNLDLTAMEDHYGDEIIREGAYYVPTTYARMAYFQRQAHRIQDAMPAS